METDGHPAKTKYRDKQHCCMGSFTRLRKIFTLPAQALTPLERAQLARGKHEWDISPRLNISRREFLPGNEYDEIVDREVKIRKFLGHWLKKKPGDPPFHRETRRVFNKQGFLVSRTIDKKDGFPVIQQFDQHGFRVRKMTEGKPQE